MRSNESAVATVGIVGGGQLARMLVLAGVPLGLRFTVLDPAPDACASAVAPLIQAPYDDPEGLARLAAEAQVITFDFENVPRSAAERLARERPVYPPPPALAAAQDRLAEKTLFNELGIATAPFAAVDSVAALSRAVEQTTGLPALLKTRRFGYDGKGQRLLREAADLAPAWQALADASAAPELIVEGFVPFEREVSMLAVRGRDGATAFYPLVENQHREGILRRSLAPCHDGEDRLTQQAREYAGKVLDRLDYVGLLAIEFFVLNGQLVANEMAPRVHNSGHWTIEGAETSQFENHLRAITGLPLGSTAARGHSAMLNFIGELPDPMPLLGLPGVHYHSYGKAPRPGRKVGHLTLRADSGEALQQTLGRLRLPE